MFRRIVFFSTALTIAGCSSLHVNSQQNPNADLAKLRTFSFAQQAGGGAQPPNSISDTQIKQSVTSNLAQIGVRSAPAGTRPDFLVAYGTSTFNVITESPVGVGFGVGVASNVGVGVSAPVGSNQVEQHGSLTLSFVDPRKNEEIWRSTATAQLDGDNQDLEKIQKAVQKMIADFEGARVKNQS